MFVGAIHESPVIAFLPTKSPLQNGNAFAIIPSTQGSYIGNTTASQAVKAGSTPVPCSKDKDTTHPVVSLSFYTGRESNWECNSPVDCCRTQCAHWVLLLHIDSLYPAPKKNTPHRGVSFFLCCTGVELEMQHLSGVFFCCCTFFFAKNLSSRVERSGIEGSTHYRSARIFRLPVVARDDKMVLPKVSRFPQDL